MSDLPHIIDYDKNQLAYALANALKERDEARTTIEDAKRALKATDYEGILLAAMRVKEERDEAREEVRLLKGILDLIKKEAQ